MRLPNFALGASLALLCLAPVVAEQIDNCASLLGSIAVELRVARALPPERRTTFTCPRDSAVLVGATRQRVLNALGTPDATTQVADENGLTATAWSYFFSGDRPGERMPGVPELMFVFGPTAVVSAIRCQRTH